MRGSFGQQIVQTLIPELQLIEPHFHPARLFPHRGPAAALGIAHIEILQPLRQGVLAAGPGEPIGQQRKDSSDNGWPWRSEWLTGVQNRAQREFVEQVSGDQDRSPRGGARSGDVVHGNPARRGGLVLQAGG